MCLTSLCLSFEHILPLQALVPVEVVIEMEVPITPGQAIAGPVTLVLEPEDVTAWIYSKVLHFLHQITGVTCFSVYPYQLGHGNEEAVKSGAFWFYRKLGFWPVRPELLSIMQREEAKMARDPAHRTSAGTLRKLAAHSVFYEFGEGPRGLWNTFSTATISISTPMVDHFPHSSAEMHS